MKLILNFTNQILVANMVCAKRANKLKWKFSEVELHYRDLFHGKIYEVLLN